MEQALEDALRGARGRITRHIDDKPDERIEPRPGGVAQLTIDARLQVRVQGILDPRFGLTRVQPWHGQENELPLGTPLAAGAVVIDVKTGEVLAMVSSPTELPESLQKYRATLAADAENEKEANKKRPEGEKHDEKRKILEQFDRDFPSPEVYHRALDIPYAPGSIVKPLFMSWAMSHANWGLQHVVDCQGHFYPENREMLRCWIYRPPSYAVHGPLGPVEAIARSCNMYFYTIGSVLGLERCRQVYRDWGLGRPLDIGLSLYNRPVEYANAPGRSEALMLAMGQGSVAWTPLHAATAYAALARGGYYISPTLIRDDPRGIAPIREDLELDDQAVYLALKGLHEVVNNQQYGGARHIDVDPVNHKYEPIFNAESVNVWGKTGTAQQYWPTRIMRYDFNGEPLLDAAGRPVFIERARAIGSHSWFVGLTGPGSGDGRASPEYAIAVIVEWGGSGSRCAGPIANQIIHALKAEGYLP
jgi:cell division protein FtsI/penicillin-binding protein 2